METKGIPMALMTFHKLTHHLDYEWVKYWREAKTPWSFNKRDGSILGPTGDIKTSQTVFKMSGLNKYYNSIGTCKIHLKTLSGSATISGTLSED